MGMETYHKIQTVFKRDPETKFKTLLEGEYSLPEFDYLKNNKWVFTEKVDGTNIRVMWDGLELRFKGKTDAAEIPKPLFVRLKERFTESIMAEHFGIENTGVCLYGEGYGAKIQKGGGNYRKDQDFVLFDVDIDSWWLKRSCVKDISKNLNIDIVPVVGSGTLIDMVEMCKNGFKSGWGDFQAEGFVARPEVELRGRNGQRIITKIKCKDFK